MHRFPLVNCGYIIVHLLLFIVYPMIELFSSISFSLIQASFQASLEALEFTSFKNIVIKNEIYLVSIEENNFFSFLNRHLLINN